MRSRSGSPPRGKLNLLSLPPPAAAVAAAAALSLPPIYGTTAMTSTMVGHQSSAATSKSAAPSVGRRLSGARGSSTDLGPVRVCSH